MKLKTIILAISLSCFGFAAIATDITSTVEKFYVNQHGVVLFKLGLDSPTECIDTNWPFGFRLTDTAGKEWFQMLHEAKLQGKEISIGYAENSPSRCTIGYIYYNN